MSSITYNKQIMDSEVYELPAVKSLGPLFKLSEVHLWDDGSSGGRDSLYSGCEKWGHYGYKEYERNKNKVDSAPCKNEIMPNGLYLIASTTERKCSISQQSRFYVAMKSRNDDICSTNSNKKVRTTKSIKKLSISSDNGVLREDTPNISKYWSQRYQLFSRFDRGIKMDEEGWFSVTPEAIAKHQAIRCGDGVIADLFTGVGGNSIQFAQRSKRVIAIDIDPNKITYARHNAFIYEVEDNINFINTDCFSIAPKLKADTVFMSPPWGGPNYTKVKRFDINTMLEPRDGQFLFDIGKEIAPHIVMFLPRNVDINQLAELALSVTPSWSLEVEKNFLNGRLKAITTYFVQTSKI